MSALPLLQTAHSAITFEDTFTIHTIDAEGRKYDRVSRLTARSLAFEMDLVLDYHSEIFPLSPGEGVTVVLAKSLQKGLYEEETPEVGGKDGEGKKKEREQASWRVDGPVGLEEYFDYVCYGKVYRFDEGVGEKVYVRLHSTSRRSSTLRFTPLPFPSNAVQLRHTAAAVIEGSVTRRC
jgi:DNA-directed RNA polymerases I, II, and III subunit RPABC3